MPKAILELRSKQKFADGAILEMVVWRLPHTDHERPHGFKYSLYYGKNGKRLIGYDNERGKGDHRHLGAIQENYEFLQKNQDFQKTFLPYK